MSKYLYRIEHEETRIGPYQTCCDSDYGVGKLVFELVRSKTNENICTRDDTPVPRSDGLGDHIRLGGGGNGRFGFKSIKRLKSWFTHNPEVYKVFDKCDMVLARYKVLERFDSKFQSVAYIKEMSERVVLPYSKLNLK